MSPTKISANLRESDAIAREIAEDREVALAQFATSADYLARNTHPGERKIAKLAA